VRLPLRPPLAALAVLLAAAPLTAQDYEPEWDSLSKRPVPEWFPEAKFGIFIHWGVYSVPAFSDTSTYSEWYQYWLDTNSHGGLVRRFHEANYGPGFEYRDFASRFRAELFDPEEWARILRRSGARYVVLTSKHHDGFCLWPDTRASAVRGYPWTAAETGPRRDLVGELTEAVRAAGLRMGLYYSFMEWHNPLFEEDPDRYVAEYMIPQIQDLILRYRPDVFWPDGEWNHPDSFWRSPEILAWIYENAPNREEIVVNDRWGRSLRGSVGDFSTTEYGHLGGARGMRRDRPFEECRGIGHSFAWNRAEGYDLYMSRTECVRLLVDLVSQGGNLLLDIGPTADGRIPLILQDRLFAIGRWLEKNGVAIYGTEAGPFRRLSWGRSTVRGDHLYLHVYDWPEDGRLRLRGLLNDIEEARLLHDPEGPPVAAVREENGDWILDLSCRLPGEHVSVLALDLDGAPRVEEWFGPGEDGVLELPAAAAGIEGPSLRTESMSGPGGRPVLNLGYWTSLEDRAKWAPVRLPEHSTWRLRIEYACAPGQEGGRLAVELRTAGGALALDLPVEPATGSWRDYAWLGPFDLELPPALAGAELEVMVRALEIPADALMNLRRIVLEPR